MDVGSRSWSSIAVMAFCIRTSSDSAALDRRLEGVRYIMGNEIQSIPS